MLSFFKDKKDDQREIYRKRIQMDIEFLNQGRQNYLAPVYQALASNDEKIVKCAAEAIAAYLAILDTTGFIRLDEQFRQYSSLEWYSDWEKIDLNILKKQIANSQNYIWVMRLGTFHPNGFFRAKCLGELKREKGSLGFWILRLNDWAEPVRKIAESGCRDMIGDYSAEELISILPYLQKASCGNRANRTALKELHKNVTDRIWNQIEHVDWRNLQQYDLKTRKYLYQLLLDAHLLSKEEIMQILGVEKSGECQALLLTKRMEQFEVPMQDIDDYLQHKSKLVQRIALDCKYSILGDYWDGLEKMLLNGSAGIRGTVCFILQRHTTFDIVSYYVQNLDTSYRKICILGIGENGTEKDAEIIMKYLQDADASVVKNTLHAIGLLLKEDAKEIFWQFLQDERPIVMRQANREMIHYHIKYGAKRVYDLLVSTDSLLLKEKLSYQLMRESSWDRLPYALMLYSCEEEIVRNVMQRAVGGRNAYAQISREKADWIRELLQDPDNHILEDVQKSIQFDLKYVVKT